LLLKSNNVFGVDMSKLTFRGEEHVLDAIGRISGERGKDKGYAFKELAKKIEDNPDDFNILMEWYDSDQSLAEFTTREVSEKSVAGMGLVLEGLRTNDIEVAEEGLDRVDSGDYPHLEAETRAQTSLISKQYQQLVKGFSDLLEGVSSPKPDRSQAYRGAAKLGVANPDYAEEALDLLDVKFEEDYWSDTGRLAEDEIELLYEGITGIVESVEEENFEEALEYGEGLMRLDEDLGDMLADYIVERSSQNQIER